MTPNIRYLRERADLLRELRAFFDSRGFLEVQPPCLASDCVVDAYLDPIQVDSQQLRISDVELPPRMFLQTSPESAMKRMVAAGAPSIYSLGPVFRAGEHGHFHNIEFTMLEWYEVGGDMSSGIQLLGELAMQMLNQPSFDVKTYHDVFADLKIDPDTNLDQLRTLLNSDEQDLVESIGSDHDGLLDVLMATRVQPTLGIEHPVIVKDYPATQCALAKELESGSKNCCARFELFARGVELANGYDELTDPNIFVDRAAIQNQM